MNDGSGYSALNRAQYSSNVEIVVWFCCTAWVWLTSLTPRTSRLRISVVGSM